jgi:hypothetical protein
VMLGLHDDRRRVQGERHGVAEVVDGGIGRRRRGWWGRRMAR